MSTVQKVRGAPAPLTAGPPGTRQRRLPIFERDILQRAREFDDETPMMNPYHVRQPFSRHIGDLSFEDDSMPSALNLENTEPDDQEDNNSKCRISVVDTLPPDRVYHFYSHGLPPDFDMLRQEVSTEWDIERLTKLESPSDPCLVQTRDFWDERARDIDKHFYSGVNTFSKTFDVALTEHRRRSIAYIVGCPYKEPPSNQGKVINRKLQVRDACLMPASEQYGFCVSYFLFCVGIAVTDFGILAVLRLYCPWPFRLSQIARSCRPIRPIRSFRDLSRVSTLPT